MEIRRLDPADAEPAVRAHAVLEPARRSDTPEHPPATLRRFTGAPAAPPPGSELHGHVALDGEAVIGYTSVHLPVTSNPHYAEAELTVHPRHRRQGIGTALLDRFIEHARAHDRTELLITAP